MRIVLDTNVALSALLRRGTPNLLSQAIRRHEHVQLLCCRPGDSTRSLRVVAADPDDDQVIAAAIAAEADFLVSGDHHLLALGSHKNFHIVAPTETMRLIGAA